MRLASTASRLGPALAAPLALAAGRLRRGADRHLPQRQWRPRASAPRWSSSPAKLRPRQPPTRLRVAIGKRTKECSYRTPVLGRDLEIAATDAPAEQARPKSVQRRPTWRSTCAPAAAPATSSPSTRCRARPQLRKVLADGTIDYLESRRTSSRSRGRRQSQTSCACAPSTSPPATKRALQAPRLRRPAAGRRRRRRAAGDLRGALPGSPSVAAWNVLDRPCRTISLAGIAEMSEPLKFIVPAVARSTPLITLNTVVLPAPLGPISPSTSPWRHGRSRP